MGGQLINLLTFAITARLLSPSDFGLYGITLLIGAFLVTIAESVLSNGVVQKELIDERHIESLNVMCLVAGLAAAILCVAVSPLTERFFGYSKLTGCIALMAIALPFKFMSSVRFALLQRSLDFRKVQLANFAGIACSLAVTVLLAAAGFGVYSLVLGFIALAMGEFLCALLFERRKIAFRYHYVEGAEILDFAWPYLVSQISNYVAIQGYSLIIGRFGGAVMLGIFTRVYTLMMVPVNLAGGVGSKIVFASAARLQNDRATLKKVLGLSIEVATLIFIPFSIACVLASKAIVDFVLGVKWTAAVEPMKILFAVLFARLGYIVPESILVGLGRVRSSARRQTVYAATTIIFSWVGLHWFGLDGVAIGVALAIVVFYISSLLALNDILGRELGYYLGLHLEGLLIAVPAIAAYFILDSLLMNQGWISGLDMAAYVAVLFITYCLIPADNLGVLGALKIRLFSILRKKFQ